MDFLAGIAIVLVGAFVLVIAGIVGLFATAGGSRGVGLGALGVALAMLGLYVALGLSADDGQPWAVYGGKYGGSDELPDAGRPLAGLWLRSMLLQAGLGLLLGWLLVTLINLKNRVSGR